MNIDENKMIMKTYENKMRRILGVSKSLQFKILAKLTKAQNWRKLSVSPIGLTLSGIFSTEIISNYIVL